MLSDDGGSGGPICSKDILAKIASALNCSIEDFSDNSSCCISETIELIDLWSKIKHVQDRNKVLSFIRTAAEKQF